MSIESDPRRPKQALQGGKSDTGDKPVADATTHTGGATEAVDTGGHAATEEILVPTEKSDGGIPNVAADANTTDANDLRAAWIAGKQSCKRYGKCTRIDGACVLITSEWISTPDGNYSVCKESAACKSKKVCAHFGAANASSDEDCQGLAGCKQDGKCTHFDGQCIKASGRLSSPKKAFPTKLEATGFCKRKDILRIVSGQRRQLRECSGVESVKCLRPGS